MILWQIGRFGRVGSQQRIVSHNGENHRLGRQSAISKIPSIIFPLCPHSQRQTARKRFVPYIKPNSIAFIIFSAFIDPPPFWVYYSTLFGGVQYFGEKLQGLAQRSGVRGMNDTTVWCQNPSVTEPQRDPRRSKLRHIIGISHLVRQAIKPSPFGLGFIA